MNYLVWWFQKLCNTPSGKSKGDQEATINKVKSHNVVTHRIGWQNKGNTKIGHSKTGEEIVCCTSHVMEANYRSNDQ